MDFARKQLEKYGWTDGKGLGKNENGISQALKPKLKRSVAGIGYDAASDFTEHWWSALYDKAAKNVEVEEKNGKTKKIKTKDDDEFEITNSTWKINKKKKNSDEPAEAEYSDFFVRKDILTGGKVKSKKVKKESDSEEERDATTLTDEQLFAACGGRTAHKGARHGLKALGKLARIEQQEQMLLQQARFKGYSQAKSLDPNEEDAQVFEEGNLNDFGQNIIVKKKKKKKRCNSFNRNIDDQVNSVIESPDDTKLSENDKKGKRKRNVKEETTTEDSHEGKTKHLKTENKSCGINEESVNIGNFEDKNVKLKLKKKKRKTLQTNDQVTTHLT